LSPAAPNASFQIICRDHLRVAVAQFKANQVIGIRRFGTELMAKDSRGRNINPVATRAYFDEAARRFHRGYFERFSLFLGKVETSASQPGIGPNT
jgi:hypothetical protein